MNTRFEFQQETHGVGGFGRVVKGRDNYLERDIAVKILNPLVTKFSEPERERFKREARIIANLKHPNIPAIYDVEFSDDRFLIMFEFIDGKTLREVIKEGEPCSLADARRWLTQVASALDYAHQNKVVHRDVKPENIIISPDNNTAYLVDFGIAISASDGAKLTKEGFVVGTPGYMSPEQQNGDDVDWRTDIYSLGVTLYESLAGKQIALGQYEELAGANEAISPEIDQLILDCIRPLDERLDQARDFSARLVGALQPARPLSEVLTQGSLYEIANALEDLSAVEFARLPAGQRSLVLLTIEDVLSTNDPKLKFASERLIALLVERGIMLNDPEFTAVVRSALHWAFNEIIRGKHGSNQVRLGLKVAAYESRGHSHDVLTTVLGEFTDDCDLNSLEHFALIGLRDILQSLLANPACSADEDKLVAAMREARTLLRGFRKSQIGPH